MTNIQEKNDDMPSALTPSYNMHNGAKQSDSETLVSIANSKDP